MSDFENKLIENVQDNLNLTIENVQDNMDSMMLNTFSSDLTANYMNSYNMVWSTLLLLEEHGDDALKLIPERFTTPNDQRYLSVSKVPVHTPEDSEDSEDSEHWRNGMTIIHPQLPKGIKFNDPSYPETLVPIIEAFVKATAVPDQVVEYFNIGNIRYIWDELPKESCTGRCVSKKDPTHYYEVIVGINK